MSRYSKPKDLRIASLLPSTTDICISLGLKNNVVGITHECDFNNHPLFDSTDPLIVGIQSSDSDFGIQKVSDQPLTLTVSQIDPDLQSQAQIDTAVKTSLHNGMSLYNLSNTALTDALPSLILTQSLCDVCAVDKSDVEKEVACNFRPGQSKVLSLEPQNLHEVVETFQTVAEACGVKERGIVLKTKFWEGAYHILEVVSSSANTKDWPTVLYFEWLDPPFDAGHWIPDMFKYSGCRPALDGTNKKTQKSVQLTWEEMYKADPDVVIVGCCGFDMKRNVKDALAAKSRLEPLRAYKDNRIYATDGNL